MENLLTSSNILGLNILPLLDMARSTEVRQPPSLEEECVDIDNLYGPTLEGEMGNMARYARCTSASLTLGASGYYEAF